MTETEPTEIKDLVLNRIGDKNLYFAASISSDGSHALINRIVGFELWNLRKKQKVKYVPEAQDIVGLYFSLDGNTIVCHLSGGVMTIYDMETGEKIAELSGIGISDVIYVDASCYRILVWTDEGRVLQYDEGREILRHWFWPSHKCN